jgi:hypothetical protein
MGWTSYTIDTTATTDAVLRREFTQAGTDGSRWEITDAATIGATWYAISKRTDATGAAHYSGLVCLTERRKQRNGITEFFYKDIDETAGPYSYACPARILDQLDQLAPNPPEYAAKWRQACRDQAANKRAKAKARAKQRAESMAKIERFISDRFLSVNLGA